MNHYMFQTPGGNVSILPGVQLQLPRYMEVGARLNSSKQDKNVLNVDGTKMANFLSFL